MKAHLVTSAVSAAAVTAVLTRVLQSAPSLELRNHRGDAVSLSEGAAVATSLTTCALARQHLAAGGALALTSAVGMADDLYGGHHDGQEPIKGLKGHWRALRRGRVSTGAVKVAGIGTAALAYNLARRARRGRNWADLVIDTALVAGSANLANLFDLRPGRALKTTLVPIAVTAVLAPHARSAAAATTATVLAAAGSDLRGETMLGDAGANPLGLQCGMMLSAIESRSVRLTAAGITVGLILASEKVSFTQVIAANPVLNALDMAGRARG